MVAGKYRSRSYRRVQRKTPGGKTVQAYLRKKPKSARCFSCGKSLHGVARQNAFHMKDMPRSAKRPSRPYGGVLCSQCAREKIKENARKGEKK